MMMIMMVNNELFDYLVLCEL